MLLCTTMEFMVNEILEKAREMLKNNIDLELVEIVDSSDFGCPRKEGAFMFVDASGKSFGTVGGGTYEYKCTNLAKELVVKKVNSEKKFELNQEGTESIGMVCGGNNLTRFTYLTNDEKSYSIIENIEKKNQNKHIVYLFGAGHVSVELSKVLRYVGFEYVVWDDREDFATRDRFKDAKEIIVSPYNKILEKINITKDDFVVSMTRGHGFDYEVMKQTLKTDAFYIGMIGSANKNKTIKEKLSTDGYTEKEINRICAPIGFGIGAETPEEIAISIVGEIILYRAIYEKRQKVMADNKLVELYKTKWS